MVLFETTLGPLAPEHWSEIVMGVVLFLVAWLVIWKKVVPVFEATYAERVNQIQGGIERADRAQAEAYALREQYEARLSTARDEAARIREEAKNQGAQIIAELRTQANAESARILEAGRHQLAAERVQVLGQLRTEVGGLATALAGRIVQESLEDDERARRTVDRFLDDLDSRPVPAGQAE